MRNMSERAEYSEDVILPPDGYRFWWVDAYTRRGEKIHYEVLMSTESEADIIYWPFARGIEARKRIEAHEAANKVKKPRRRRSVS